MFRKVHIKKLMMKGGINRSFVRISPHYHIWASQLARVVKSLPDNSGDAIITGLMPMLGKFLGLGNGDPL